MLIYFKRTILLSGFVELCHIDKMFVSCGGTLAAHNGFFYHVVLTTP